MGDHMVQRYDQKCFHGPVFKIGDNCSVSGDHMVKGTVDGKYFCNHVFTKD
jgi:hypothetical protein